MTTTAPSPAPASRLDAALFRHRLAVVLLPFAIAILSASLTKGGGLWANVFAIADIDDGVAFIATGVCCLVAAALRIGGEAHIGAAVYAQGDTLALITGGLFARLRNPLYWGTWLFFVALGAVWAPAVVWAPATVVFGVALNAIVRHEEHFLAARFGDAYQRYCAEVPRWLPKLGASTMATTTVPLRVHHVVSAAVGNLGFLSFAAYRLITGSLGQVRGLGLANVLLCMGWVVVVLWRRQRERQSPLRSRSDESATMPPTPSTTSPPPRGTRGSPPS